MTNQRDTKEEVSQVLEWLSSPEGKESMRKAREANAPFIKALQDSRKISWELMHRPFTI